MKCDLYFLTENETDPAGVGGKILSERKKGETRPFQTKSPMEQKVKFLLYRGLLQGRCAQ